MQTLETSRGTWPVSDVAVLFLSLARISHQVRAGSL